MWVYRHHAIHSEKEKRADANTANISVFSVARRSRSDSRQLLSQSVIVSTDLTDVTLVIDDNYRSLD